MKCDFTLDRVSACDVYLRVSINDEIVKDFKPHRKIIWPGLVTALNLEYTTPEPISKNSEILIQMFDWDESTADDEMGEWILTKDQIGKRVTLVSGVISKNELTIEAQWI